MFKSPIILYATATCTRENNSISLQRGTPTMTFGGSGSGKPPGRPRGSRNALTEAVICAILRDFSKHGEKAVAEVRRKQPGAYLKICAWLVPREHKVEQMNTFEGLSTEQIRAYIAAIQDRLDRRAAGHQAKVISGEAIETTAAATTTLPVLEPPKRRSNRLMTEADTAIGPRERKPRKPKKQLPRE
jgi:hypothetical protein